VFSTSRFSSGSAERLVKLATWPAVLLAHALPTRKERRMAEGKGFFESLLDFSFRECVTISNRKLLYGLHLLVG
jgi:hypothetical protein